MKVCLLLLILAIFCSAGTDAQIKTYQLTLKDSDAAVLYYGIPNRIRILGIKGSDQITLRNAPSSYYDGNSYSFYPPWRSVSRDTLRVRRAGKVVYTKVFAVRTLPNMAARMGEIKDSFATVQQILAYPKMGIYFGDDTLYNGEWFQLRSFVMIANDQQGQEHILPSNGNYLSQEQRGLIATMKRGSRLRFDEIRASCGDCTIRALNPFTITIR